MKRFWKDVSAEAYGSGWRVLLDGRAVKTQGGRARSSGNWPSSKANLTSGGYDMETFTKD